MLFTLTLLAWAHPKLTSFHFAAFAKRYNYKVVIHADRTPRGEHERRYNAPRVNEVSLLVTDEPFSPRDIVLRTHDNTLQRIADTHIFYDALQYPLKFSKGEPGYHFNIPVVNPTTKQPIPNKKVSCMDFYAYYTMLREHDFNFLLHTRQLFHQFLVDMYIKVESERLRYIALNQKKLRAENYIHLQDAISADDNIRSNDIGKMVILQSTFMSSPRYLLSAAWPKLALAPLKLTIIITLLSARVHSRCIYLCTNLWKA
ncbi:hypothetical protein TNCV_3283381 [Trichonephila clavipes]|nr:hypothetical protein TNCV_3283381 [Trichonephila clavipes]